MPISDYEMIAAWKEVLTLSKLEAGQTVTILTSASTHPQTLSSALIATQSGFDASAGNNAKRVRLAIPSGTTLSLTKQSSKASSLMSNQRCAGSSCCQTRAARNCRFQIFTYAEHKGTRLHRGRAHTHLPSSAIRHAEWRKHRRPV